MAPVHSLRKCGRVLYTVSRAVLYDSVPIVLHFHDTYQEENESGVILFYRHVDDVSAGICSEFINLFSLNDSLRLRHVFCCVRSLKERCLPSGFTFDCNEK